MRLVDADKLFEKFSTTFPASEAFQILVQAPTVCDIEQISSARYNNGFYDGKKAMEEKIEQIRDEIEKQSIADFIAVSTVIEILDKYTKGVKHE